MRLNNPFDFYKDQRRYPIQRDEDGQSLRQRCFTLFKRGKKADEVAVILRMKLSTARRYYSEWNRCPPSREGTYKSIKQGLKKSGDLSPNIVGMIGKSLGIPEWEVLSMISRPYGLKQLIMGDLVQQKKKKSYNSQEERLEAALSLVVLHEKLGIPMDWIVKEVKKLTQRARKYKEKMTNDTDKSMDEDSHFFDDFGFID